MPDTQMFPLVPVQREGQSAWRQTKSLKDGGRLPAFDAKSLGHMLAGSLSPSLPQPAGSTADPPEVSISEPLRRLGM